MVAKLRRGGYCTSTKHLLLVQELCCDWPHGGSLYESHIQYTTGKRAVRSLTLDRNICEGFRSGSNPAAVLIVHLIYGFQKDCAPSVQLYTLGNSGFTQACSIAQVRAELFAHLSIAAGLKSSVH